MEDSGGQRTDGAISSSCIEYATTGTEDIQREASPSLSPMELDQPGGSTDEHGYVSSNGISTSNLSTQAQAQAQ
jgi:hypothetical protein